MVLVVLLASCFPNLTNRVPTAVQYAQGQLLSFSQHHVTVAQAATDDMTEDEELARAIAQSLQDPGTSGAAAAAAPAGVSGASGGRAHANGDSGAAPPSQPLPKGVYSSFAT